MGGDDNDCPPRSSSHRTCPKRPSAEAAGPRYGGRRRVPSAHGRRRRDRSGQWASRCTGQPRPRPDLTPAPTHRRPGTAPGQLLGAAKSSSTIDALVVAEAIQCAPAIIWTSDPSDLRQLVGEHHGVTVEPI